MCLVPLMMLLMGPCNKPDAAQPTSKQNIKVSLKHRVQCSCHSLGVRQSTWTAPEAVVQLLLSACEVLMTIPCGLQVSAWCTLPANATTYQQWMSEIHLSAAWAAGWCL